MIAVLVVTAIAPALGQRVNLDVLANVGRDGTLYFEGTVTARGLSPKNHLQVRNELEVSVEFIEARGRFGVLPTLVQPASNEAWRGGRPLTREQMAGVGAQRVVIAGQALALSDDGKPFGVSGTVRLAGADRFRIIATLRHTWAGSWPASECFYAIAGPFKVKPGVARERRDGGLLDDVGRFLQRSARDVGRVALRGAGLFLAAGGSPIAALQQALLGEVEQRQDAFGMALRYIGRAAIASTEVRTVDQVLVTSDNTTGASGSDLTRALVEGLVARYLGAGGVGPGGTTKPTPIRSWDDAVEVLRADLQHRLGLRDLNITLADGTVVVTSAPPALEGYGHLEPIIAYILVNAALAAPAAEQVAAIFDDAIGGSFGLRVPAEAARQYAQGEMDTATFLSQCTFTDAAALAATGAATATAPTSRPAAPRTVLTLEQLPAGWLASGSREIDAAELQRQLPALRCTLPAGTWSAMQVVQTDRGPVTVIALAPPTAEQAATIAHEITTLGQGRPSSVGTTELPGTPPLHLARAADRVYLLSGETAAVGAVAALLTGEDDAAPRVLRPAPAPPPEPAAAPTPSTVALSPASFIRKARLVTGVTPEGDPESFYGTLPEGAERVGVYLDIVRAPEESEILLTWYRDGQELARRLLVVTGDRRTVSYLTPREEGGFPPGTYWLEITTNGTLAARLVFTNR